MTLDGPAVTDAKARYWLKITIFAQLWGTVRNITKTFGIEKLERCGYPMVKDFEDVYSFRQNTRT